MCVKNWSNANFFCSDLEAKDLVINFAQLPRNDITAAPDHTSSSTPSLTNKSWVAAAPQQPRNVRQQPEDDYSDSSGGLSGYEYPTWYSSIENNGYYPGRFLFWTNFILNRFPLKDYSILYSQLIFLFQIY